MPLKFEILDCGLAYCKTLRFSTSYLGENVKSIMTCDAQKMRAMLVENKKYTLDEIWDEHKDYNEYLDAKLKLFEQTETAIINLNTDDLEVAQQIFLRTGNLEDWEKAQKEAENFE